MLVKLSPSPTSLGKYAARMSKSGAHFGLARQTWTFSDLLQVRRYLRPKNFILCRMGLARCRKRFPHTQSRSARLRKQLISPGLYFPQHSKDSVCMGEWSVFSLHTKLPLQYNLISSLGPGEIVQWRGNRSSSVCFTYMNKAVFSTVKADGSRITCQVYIMEICPNRIRGGMVLFQAVW